MQPALINKSTLSFVIKKTKVTYDYLERKTKFDINRIKSWEDPDNPSLPSINQAKKLAKHLRIPFAGLYMDSNNINIKHLPFLKNMRTKHGVCLHDDSSLNLALIDLIKDRELLLDTMSELEESISPFKLSISTDDVKKFSKKIRDIFQLDLTRQCRCPSARQLYLYIRNQVEEKDIFIHNFSGVPFETARGVAVYYNILPIIGINQNDRYPAKTFTIIHELVHILKYKSTICNDIYNSFSAKQEEVFCNAVAGEVLVPENSLISILKDYPNRKYSIDNITKIAKIFSVSKEVIIRRLLDLGYISDIAYKAYSEEIQRIFEMERLEMNERQKEAKKLGKSAGIPRNMPREAIDKNSATFSKTLFKGYEAQLFSKRDIARYIGIAHKHIDKFLGEVSLWSK